MELTKEEELTTKKVETFKRYQRVLKKLATQRKYLVKARMLKWRKWLKKN